MAEKKTCNCQEIIKKAESSPFLTGGLASCLTLLGIEFYADKVGETARVIQSRTFFRGILAACVLLGIGTKISNDCTFTSIKKE
jgi:hypothetical protein